jgi:cell division septation protein DedD
MEPGDKKEEQLAADLEAMYRRVAAIERPDEGPKQADGLFPDRWPEQDPPEERIDRTAEAAAHEPPPPSRHTPLSPDEGRRHLIPGLLAVVFVCLSVLLYAAFFWPTLYDVASISAGNKIYPIRINRITGSVVYFDGEQWRKTPLPASAAPVVPAMSVPVPAPPAPAATTSVTETSVPAKAAPVAAAPTTAGRGSLREKQALPDRRPASFALRKKQAAPPGTAADGRFAVQIKAFANPDDARKLVAAFKKTGLDVYSVTAPIGGRGVWSRVLIGRFEDPKEALKFMQEKKLKDRYPDSFVQKLFP